MTESDTEDRVEPSNPVEPTSSVPQRSVVMLDSEEEEEVHLVTRRVRNHSSGLASTSGPVVAGEVGTSQVAPQVNIREPVIADQQT